ncbi:unnamed protein product [Rotaria sp. Silwood1]|nr:unnamed protein product [Rotaria sp. Silwood1]CAF4629563.1 unnamed protein product [Rotaria sp. Silwood1]
MLAEFNKHFSNAYKQTRTHLLNKVDPLIIFNGDYLTLFHRGKQTRTQLILPLYDDLKAISHIPFTIYLRLFNILFDNKQCISSNQTEEFQIYLNEIDNIRQSLDFPSSSADNILQTQEAIIDLSIDYLHSIIKSKQLNEIELKQFCQKASQLFTINFKRAARLSLDLLHSIVQNWYTKLFNEIERQSVKILILGPKAARNGFIAKLYFYKLLNVEQEGERIVYVESVYDEQQALAIFGSWLLDAEAGDMFFNDRSQLHRDLMMDAANLYITKLFQQQKN